MYLYSMRSPQLAELYLETVTALNFFVRVVDIGFVIISKFVKEKSHSSISYSMFLTTALG